MRVKILGSAAGGGFPQWNCACENCRAVRAGTFRGQARSQAQVVVSAGIEGSEQSWFLLGASPDLRGQIEATPELRPRAGVRQSPIAGAVLANADVDQVLGLLLLRELQPLRVHATSSIRRILAEDNSMFAMLQRVPGQLTWSDFAPGASFPLCDSAGKESGLRCLAISLGAHYPAYVSAQRRAELVSGEASLGLMVESAAGARLAYMPAVPQIDEALLKDFESADVLLFEPDARSRRRMLPFLVIGCLTGLYILWALVAYPTQTFIQANSIVYINPATNNIVVAVLYIIATCGSLFFSKIRDMVIFGVANVVILLVVMAVKRYAFTSCASCSSVRRSTKCSRTPRRCVGAAVASVIVLVYFWKSHEKRPFRYLNAT